MASHRENPEKSGNLTLVEEIWKNQGNRGFPVICYCSCDNHKIINPSTVKVDVHEIDCKYCHSIHSGVHVGLSVYLWWFNNYQCLLGEIPGEVGEFDRDWRVAILEAVKCSLNPLFVGFN